MGQTRRVVVRGGVGAEAAEGRVEAEGGAGAPAQRAAGLDGEARADLTCRSPEFTLNHTFRRFL